MNLPTLLAKNNAESSTPTKTPYAKLWVTTTTATVLHSTTLVVKWYARAFLSESQENVPTDTIIMTETKAAMGMILIKSLKNTTIMSKNTPATKVDKRPRPPDLMLMTD